MGNRLTILKYLIRYITTNSNYNNIFKYSMHKWHRLDAAKIFTDAGIPTTVILDAAVSKYMEFVDLCIVGAEGVMENGGIVNKVKFIFALN